MRRIINLLPAVALAAGITASLAFGASTALACATCPEEIIVDCSQEAEPDEFCADLCLNEGCFAGGCKPASPHPICWCAS